MLDGKKVPKSKVTVEDKETEAVPEAEALEQPEVTKVKLEGIFYFLDCTCKSEMWFLHLNCFINSSDPIS